MLLIGTVLPVSGTIKVEINDKSTLNDGTLSGYVNDTSMNPIEGALVRVYFHGTYEEDYTDSSGYYRVTNIPICYCMKNCTASKPGYKSEWVLVGFVEDTTHDFMLTSGKVLYVGGSGPNNYTRIQDAINDSSDGDTVFVYDDSSPYIEVIVVDVSINLIGENKNTTIIDGARIDDVINVNANDVIISGFTIKNSSKNGGCGIVLHSDNNTIQNNIIKENTYSGLLINFSDYNQIIDNIIFDCKYEGVYVVGEYNKISGNYLSNLSGGIAMEGGFHNNISHNIINGNKFGILIWGFDRHNIIYRNDILNNDLGIHIDWSSKNKVIENNFIDNDENAFISKAILNEIYAVIVISLILKDLYLIKNYRVIGRNTFDGNYWDEPRKLPYPIFGQRGYLFYFLDKYNDVTFDWNPAQKPYDI